MYHKLLVLIFIFIFARASARTSPADTSDQEQHQLEQCYIYSGLFGYSIDTISNEKLYETISNWLGTRYCYAGNSKNGIDCSGFVNELYKKAFDVDLIGSSGDLFTQVKPVKKSELHEGDLVFFKIKKKRISHVGIYLGCNKFAHASVKSGVTIDDLDEPYYKKYFYRGGRIKS
jgi:lipoprotein Spr